MSENPFEWEWQTKLREKDAEIERLKAFHESNCDEWNRIEELLNNEIASLKSLVSELADALEFPFNSSRLPPLIQKAREAAGQ